MDISFEFFPPKSETMENRLWDCVERLEPMGPSFISVTYGAGGSTRERTHATLERILKDTSLKPAAHLTCVGASKADVLAVARAYLKAGVRRIVALRGDPPTGMGTKFEPHPQGFAGSVELVAALKALASDMALPLEISVACYPEPHPESRSLAADIALLRAKQEAGADEAITQFFFEPEIYFDFLTAARAGGVTLPIRPGIMLQANFQGLAKMAKAVNASVPDWLYELYAGLEEDSETRDLVTANIAVDLCRKLADQGVSEFHFYTLNKAPLALSTCRLLKLSMQTAGLTSEQNQREVSHVTR